MNSLDKTLVQKAFAALRGAKKNTDGSMHNRSAARLAALMLSSLRKKNQADANEYAKLLIKTLSQKRIPLHGEK